MTVTNLKQYQSNQIQASKCEDLARIYEKIHSDLNVIYMGLFAKHGVKVDLNSIKELSEEYLDKANEEWVHKRKYEKGEY